MVIYLSTDPRWKTMWPPMTIAWCHCFNQWFEWTPTWLFHCAIPNGNLMAPFMKWLVAQKTTIQSRPWQRASLIEDANNKDFKQSFLQFRLAFLFDFFAPSFRKVNSVSLCDSEQSWQRVIVQSLCMNHDNVSSFNAQDEHVHWQNHK